MIKVQDNLEFKIHKKAKSFTSVTPLTFPEEWSKEVSQVPAGDRNVYSIVYDYCNTLPGTIPFDLERLLATRQQTANFWLNTPAFY